MKFFLLLSLTLFTSCGTAKKGTSAPLTAPQNIPPGVLVGENKKCFAKASPLSFVPFETNKIRVQIVTQELLPLSANEGTLRVQYWMPKMKQMNQGKPYDAVVTDAKSGAFDVEMDIVHGGLWEVFLYVEKSGTLLDKFTYSVEVPNS